MPARQETIVYLNWDYAHTKGSCGSRLWRLFVLVLLCDLDTGVGFLRGTEGDRLSVSCAHQPCSDNRNTGSNAVLPAARCVWCPDADVSWSRDRGSLSFQGAALQALEGVKCLVWNSLAIALRRSGCNYSRSITELMVTWSDCALVYFKQTFSLQGVECFNCRARLEEK